MKKITALLLALCMCITVVLSLVACDKDDEHTFRSEWSHDASNHWHSCEDADCTEIKDKTAHTMKDNVLCTVCGYQAAIVNTVTAEQFNSAIQLQNVVNVTIASKKSSSTSTEIEESTMYVDGNKISIIGKDDANSYHYELLGDNRAYTYAYSTDTSPYMIEGWIKVKATLPENQSVDLDAFREEFDGITFTDCTFADGKYTCSKTYTEGVTYTVDFTIEFKNGLLSHINGTSTVGGETRTVEYTFSDYGYTTTSFPTEYKELSEMTFNPSAEWRALFLLADNVTVTSQTVLTANGVAGSKTDTFKCASGTWSLLVQDYALAGETNDEVFVYFDGGYTYVDGTKDESGELAVDEFFSMIDSLILYETCFSVSESGSKTTYHADEILLPTDDGISLVDITVVADNGVLQTIEYTILSTVESIDMTITTTMTFSNYGTTTVTSTK